MKVMNVWAPLCVHLHREKHQAALSGSGFGIGIYFRGLEKEAQWQNGVCEKPKNT